MGSFKVAEKFISINGEARRAGELAVFIRFVGCDLRCTYCDTAWALRGDAPHELMDENEIYKYIKETGVRNVTLTGGEPLIQKDIKRLLLLLSEDENLRIEIETNGAEDIRPYKGISDRISFTVDYKCPGSGMESHMEDENFRTVDMKDSVKFVVMDRNDLIRMKDVIEEYRLCERTLVYVSCVFGTITPLEIVDFMKENTLNDVKLQFQMHKFIWNPEERGV